jgi:hypothetical protein
MRFVTSNTPLNLRIVCSAAVMSEGQSTKLETEALDYTAFWLCVVGLIGIFLTGCLAFSVVDAVWPSSDPMPVIGRKYVWLISQGLSLALYLIGVVLAYLSIRHVTEIASANTAST